MKRNIKLLSFLLAVLLAFSLLPVNPVYAVESTENITQELEPQEQEEFVLPDIVPEAESAERGYIGRAKEEEKDNYTFVFKNSDNTRTMRVYSHPVKYTDDDGNIKDITLDIQSRAGGGFETKDNSIKTTFGAKLSDGIRLQHENVDIKLIPANKNITPVLSEDKQTVTYTLDTKTSLEYSLTYMGFKEDIVVSEYTGQTEYEFLLYTNGLTVKEEMGSYYLADSEGNRKANIGDIIIFTADERNNTLGSLSCIEIKENQIYGLTIHVDEEYLKDEKTVYPIRIDPTLEITSATTEGAIEDVTVQTNATYSGTLGILYLGTSNNRKYRILMRFPNLDLTGITVAQITNATVEFRDVMCQSVQVAMECRYYNGSATAWSESGTTTWSSIGGDLYVGNLIDTKTIYYGNGNEGSDINRYSFNITNAAKSWADGVYSPQQGFIFKAADESFSSTEDRLKYFGSYNRSDYRTSFTLQYTDYTPAITLNATSVDILEGATRTLTATTTPAGSTVTWSTSNSNVATVSSTGVVTAKKAGSATIYARFTDNGRTYTATCTVYVYISNGIYYFNNKSNGYRIQFNNSLSYAENSPLRVANAGTSAPTERYAFFKVEYLGKGLYSIRSMLDNKMGWTRSSTSVLSTTIGTLNSTVPTTAKWYIKYNSDGYYIYSVSGTAYTITSPAAPGSALTLASYSSSNALQRWSLNRITSAYHGVDIRNSKSALAVDDTYTFTASVYSTYTWVKGQNGFTWSLPDGDAYADIDPSTGVLTGVSPGTVTVRATYTGYSDWYDDFEVEIIPFKDGDYYIQNVKTSKYIGVDDGIIQNGKHLEQETFDTLDDQKWRFTSCGDGYYKISLADYPTYYIRLNSGEDGDENLIISNAAVTSDAKWKITVSSSGNYIFKPKSAVESNTNNVAGVNNYVMPSDGVNIIQRNYTDDNDYKDEWEVYSLVLSMVNYYDSSFNVDFANITDANNFVQSVFLSEFTLSIQMDGIASFLGGTPADACNAEEKAIEYGQIIDGEIHCDGNCGVGNGTHCKDVTNISDFLYDRPRENSHIYILWANRGEEVYCESLPDEGETSPSHDYENELASVYFVVEGTKRVPRPTVVFNSVAGEAEAEQIASMSIVLVHEIAHVLGLEDQYKYDGHGSDDEYNCVMGWFREEGDNYEDLYYNILLYLDDSNKGKPPFCETCKGKIIDLLTINQPIKGN